MMVKIKLILSLVVIGFLLPLAATYFSYFAINNDDLAFDSSLPFDNYILRVSDISEKIHIDNNWTATKTAGICTGSGTFSDPYSIENLTILADPGTCILIENSDVPFKIENCLLKAGTSHLNAGIFLNNVSTAKILRNSLYQSYIGVYLSNCNNITISENIADQNQYGIDLHICEDVTISENTARNSLMYGISLYKCFDTSIAGNIAYSNLFHGIYLLFSDHNIISGNTANSNSYCGIKLYFSDYNTVRGNTLIGNEECINDDGCEGNSFSNNGECSYGQVPIELIIIVLVIIIGSAIGIAIFLFRRVDRKRSESQN